MAFGDIIQTAVFDSDGDSSPDVAFASGVTAGNLIVSACFTGDGGLTPAGDLLEAVDHLDTGQTDGFSLGYRVVQGGDGTTWGWTQDSADQAALINREFEGPWEASPLDQTDTTAHVDDPDPSVAGPTGTTSQNDELAVAAWSKRVRAGGSGTVTVSAVSDSFTDRLNEDNQAATTAMKGVAMAIKVLTATGTPQSSATITADSGAWRVGALLATFKKAAAVGGATPKGVLSNPFSGPFGGPFG